MSSNLFLSSIIVFILVVALPLIFHLTKFLGAKSDSVRKNESYESGIRQVHTDPHDTFNIKFYSVGIVFLLFDVEVLFMFGWAVNLRELGFFGMIEMFVFIGLLVSGLIYVYKSGVLKWT